MAAISPDFKWSGFRISDPIRNPDYLQPNLFLTIQNQDVWILVPTVLVCKCIESPIHFMWYTDKYGCKSWLWHFAYA